MLTVKKLYKSFDCKGRVDVLKDVSFEVKNGDFIAINGASGSGKSTLLSIIGGMLKPDSGQVLLEDLDLYAKGQIYTNKIRADKIGFLFQQFHLISYLSVEENILAPTLISSLPNAEKKALDLIKKFGLYDRKDHKPSELSTGEMQRCAMARALISSPSILLADEPTGNLDDNNSNIILEELSAFSKNGGIVIMVTHDSRAAKKAHKVLSITDGQLHE